MRGVAPPRPLGAALVASLLLVVVAAQDPVILHKKVRHSALRKQAQTQGDVEVALAAPVFSALQQDASLSPMPSAQVPPLAQEEIDLPPAAPGLPVLQQAAQAPPIAQQQRQQLRAHRRHHHRASLLQQNASSRAARHSRHQRRVPHGGLQLLQQLAQGKTTASERVAATAGRRTDRALEGLGSDLGLLSDDDEAGASAAPAAMSSSRNVFSRTELLQDIAGVDGSLDSSADSSADASSFADSAAGAAASLGLDSAPATGAAVSGESTAKADQQSKIIDEAQAQADKALHNNEYERDMLQTQMLSSAQSMHVVKQMAVTIKAMKEQVEALEIHEKICRKHLADLKNGEYQALEAARVAETVQVVSF